MLDIQQATRIVQQALPNGTIQASIDYQDLYLFQVFTDDQFEEEMDPFFSVNKTTGEFRDFSILTDGHGPTIVSAFVEAKKGSLNGA